MLVQKVGVDVFSIEDGDGVAYLDFKPDRNYLSEEDNEEDHSICIEIKKDFY